MITLVNKMTVTGDEEEFHKALDHIGEFMRSQPGHVFYQLLKSVRNPGVYVEYAIWADADAHRSAIQSEEFRTRVKGLAGLAKPEADVFTVVKESKEG
jgi:quinol monooxygenase YgiN